MFDRFTDRARKVMGLSRQEAQRFSHDYIGVEHFLLGIIDEGGGVAADVLKNLEVDPERIRREVERLITHGTTMVTMGQIPFTPRAKKVLELSLEEASNLGHDHIGTEHLLLGLIREREGIAAQVLQKLDVRLEDVRERVLEILEQHQRREAELPAEDRFRMNPRPRKIRELLAAPAGGTTVPPQGYDRLSARARRAMKLAWQEARRLRHDRIGPEHILLGLLEEEILIGPELSRLLLLRIRAEAEKLIAPGTVPVAARTLLFTPEAETVLERAFEEAHELGHARIATPHLLLGLMRQKGSIADRVLPIAGIRREDVLAEARKLYEAQDLAGTSERPPATGLLGRSAEQGPKAMELARLEAQRFRNDCMGTEHLLLGLLDSGGAALEVLKKLGIDPRRVRTETEKRVTPGKATVAPGQIPIAPAVREALELALEEARGLGRDSVDTAHLLLGLMRETRGVAAQVLAALGVTYEAARREVSGPRSPPE